VIARPIALAALLATVAATAARAQADPAADHRWHADTLPRTRWVELSLGAARTRPCVSPGPCGRLLLRGGWTGHRGTSRWAAVRATGLLVVNPVADGWQPTNALADLAVLYGVRGEQQGVVVRVGTGVAIGVEHRVRDPFAGGPRGVDRGFVGLPIDAQLAFLGRYLGLTLGVTSLLGTGVRYAGANVGLAVALR